MPDHPLTLAVTVVAVVSLMLVALTAWLSRRAAMRVPQLGSLIDLPKARLHVVDRAGPPGSGAPPIILIHGLGGQLRHFSYQLMDDLAVSHRVIAFDRPGSGYSTWRAGAQMTLGEQVDLVEALAEYLGLKRVIVVGHSLGGAIALGVALRWSERVAGLALLAPLTRMPTPVPIGLSMLLRRADWAWRALAWSVAIPLARIRRGSWLTDIFSPDPVPADFGSRGGGDLVFRPSHVLGATRDLLDIPGWLASIEPRYRMISASLSLPIGVLYGRRDRVLSATVQGEQFAQVLQHVELRQVDAGHMLPVTCAGQCADLIRSVARAASA